MRTICALVLAIALAGCAASGPPAASATGCPPAYNGCYAD